MTWPDLQRIKNTFITHHWDLKTDPETFDQAINYTLIDFLAATLSHIDSQSWPARIAENGVILNGKPTYVNQELNRKQPQRVEYYEPSLYDFRYPEKFFPNFDPERICYQDDYILIYVKPPKLSCMPSREQQIYNVKCYIEKHLNGTTGSADIHLPSRLDMSTTGLVPISINRETHNLLQQIFQKRQIQKTYLLKTDQTPDWQTTNYKSYITKHPLYSVLRINSTDTGKMAETDFTVLQSDPDGTLIRANPITGRTHQIRVHAAALGIPVKGDNFYDGSHDQTLHLICYQLNFIHPVTNEALEIKVPQKLYPYWLSIK
jgi:RluA family pseudouridine synthase